MALEVWYQQVPDSDDAPGDPAIMLDTADDVERFVDQVAQASAGQQVSSMVEVSFAGDDDAPMLNVGIGASTGFVHWLDDDAVMSVGDASRAGTITYDYAGHPAEVPASAEVSLDDVRRAVREYLLTGGGRPTGVAWRATD